MGQPTDPNTPPSILQVAFWFDALGLPEQYIANVNSDTVANHIQSYIVRGSSLSRLSQLSVDGCVAHHAALARAQKWLPKPPATP